MEWGRPSVSVVIPTYNSEAFLADAIGSAQRQSHCPLEIIIVDDGSTDSTAAVAAGFGTGIRYTYQANAGPSAARNTGLKMATGDIIAFLDADDLWAERALEAQIGCLAADPHLDIALGLTQVLRLAEPASLARFEPFGEPWHLLSPGAAAIQRAAFSRVGGFDESMRSAEDLDWFLRANEAGVIMARHNHVVLQYRIHGGNVTRQKAWRDEHIAAAFKKSLDRRRLGEDVARLAPWFAADGQEQHPDG